MAKSKKNASKGPDIVMLFATSDQAALFCYALKRHFREEFSEDFSKVDMKIVAHKVEIKAPAQYFDMIKEVSCNPKFGRKTCSQLTATSR